MDPSQYFSNTVESRLSKRELSEYEHQNFNISSCKCKKCIM